MRLANLFSNCEADITSVEWTGSDPGVVSFALTDVPATVIVTGERMGGTRILARLTVRGGEPLVTNLRVNVIPASED